MKKTFFVLVILLGLILVFFLWRQNQINNQITDIDLQVFSTTTTTTTTSPPSIFSFAFVGDAMLGREVGYLYQDNFPKLFANFDNQIFENKDLSWLNLEGPISDKQIIQDRNAKDLVFNFSKSAINALTFLKINTVGLANNHTLNQGRSGFTTTQLMLKNAGIDYFGASNIVDQNSVKRIDKDGIKISLIAVNVLDNVNNLDNLISQENAAGRFTIILPHWGNEYQTAHSTSQENLAKDWIKNGADLIIGSHPHVIEDAEVVDGKLVFYSLGNFVFDQYFSKETQQGLILTGSIIGNQLKIVLVPIASKNSQPYILQGTEKQDIINHVCKNIQDLCQDGIIVKNML